MMNKGFKYLFLTSFCLALFIRCRAQNVEDSLRDIIDQDTVVQNTNVSPNNSYQFKEVTSPTNIYTRQVSDSELNKLKSDEEYWYINEKQPREKRETATPDVN